MPRKRSYSIFSEDERPTPIGAKRINTFGQLKTSSQQRRQHGDQSTISLDNLLSDYQEHLEWLEKRYPLGAINDARWAKLVSDAMLKTARSMVNLFTTGKTEIPKKICALHALVEMAMSVDSAPGCDFDGSVRYGNAPKALMDAVFTILESMNEDDLEQVVNEEAFLFKVKVLLRMTTSEYSISIWSDMNDVFRIVKDPGTVTFGRFFRHVKNMLEEKNADAAYIRVAKIIRKEICEYITHGMTYGTKCNALDALIGLAHSFLGGWFFGLMNLKIVLDALIEGFLKVAGTMKQTEVEEAIAELMSNSDLPFRDLNEFVVTSRSKDEERRKWMVLKFMSVSDIKDYNSKECGRQGVVARILRLYCEANDLRDDKQQSPFFSDSTGDLSWRRLFYGIEDLIEIFIDVSAPLSSGEYLAEVKDLLSRAETRKLVAGALGAYESTEYIITHIIKLVSRRARPQACFETKLSAIKTLLQVGICMAGFRHKCGRESHHASYYHTPLAIAIRNFTTNIENLLADELRNTNESPEKIICKMTS